MRLLRRTVLAGIALIGLGVTPLTAGADGPVLLTVTNPKVQGAAGTLTFTRKQLNSLDQRKIRTRTEFTDGTKTFEGPRIADLLGMIGQSDATTVRMVAANDYAVEIDLVEIRNFDPIIAMRMDGEPLSLRDKGPLWVMYPLDDFIELQDPAYNSRLIWQLTRMVLE